MVGLSLLSALPSSLLCHLFRMKFNSHLSNHSFSLSKPFCTLNYSSKVETLFIRLLSPENKIRKQFSSSRPSFTCSKNSSGPNFDPCGTPLVTLLHLTKSPFYIISFGYFPTSNFHSISYICLLRLLFFQFQRL